ncbi:MAG: hypothetical protein HQK60_16460 [Deltaproteobacteria bacterium]|nr:hypothetical protein [Deltaproteobacteria bacterium]
MSKFLPWICFAAISVAIAFLLHTKIKNILLASVLTGLVVSTIYLIIDFLVLGHLNPFLLIALISCAMISFCIGVAVGIFFARKRIIEKEIPVWSANQIRKGYARCITGFDLRVALMTDLHGEGRKFPATVDELIWPEINIKEELKSDHNGFGVFDLIDDEVRDAAHAEATMLVAFDLPEDYVGVFSSTFGLRPIPVESVSSDKSWKFLGFDVADMRTRSSGLYSFTLTESDRKRKELLRELQLNSFGLLQDEEEAIKVSRAFDEIVPSHAPFAPCGVWWCTVL